MTHTPELTRAIQLHVTTLLSDSTATKFIESYGSTRSRKGRNILVANLVAAYRAKCAYPDDGVRKFTATLDILLSRFNRPAGAASSIVVEARRYTTHNPLDWLCVGDSKHWNSCLSTGYHKELDGGTPSADSYANYANFDDLLDGSLDYVGCNAHYAVTDYYRRTNLILLTTGNPVYLDGEGYTSRVRLHLGLVTIKSPGVPAVRKKCIIWDRFYGNDQYLLPTWEKAIELSQQLELLLVTRLDRTVKYGETVYRAAKEDADTYSDYFDDSDNPVHVRLIHSTHDIEDREYRVRTLSLAAAVRNRSDSFRSFIQVNPHTLTYTYTRHPFVKRKTNSVEMVPRWEFEKQVAPNQVVLAAPLTRSKLSAAVIKSVISEYGYPVKCVTTISRKYYVFNSEHDSYRYLEWYTSYTIECYLKTVCGSALDRDAETSVVRFNDGRIVLHYLDMCGNVNTATLYDSSTYCCIHSQYNNIREVIGKIRTIDEVPYPKSIPGTHIRNLSTKRPPHEQREYLVDLFNSLINKPDFMTITAPFILDLVYGKL